MISRDGCCADWPKPCSYHEGVQDAFNTAVEIECPHCKGEGVTLASDVVVQHFVHCAVCKRRGRLRIIPRDAT